MAVFRVPFSLDRMQRYSPYFRSLVKYEGWSEGQEICLPPILTEGEYMMVFWALAAPHTYQRTLYELLYFFQQRSFQPLIQFILYFLNEEFLSDLLRLEISREIGRSSRFIAEALNTIGCCSLHKWANSSGAAMTMSQWVNQNLAQYTAVQDTTLLTATAIQSLNFGRTMISYRLLKKYIRNGVIRKRIEENKETKECCVCSQKQLTLPVGEWRLTNGLHRMPCCATPVHPRCFWNRLYQSNYPTCIKCDTPLDPVNGQMDRELSHFGHALDRMQRRDLQGIARWIVIPPPAPLSDVREDGTRNS